MRNIGGRITPATLRSWALLGRLGQGQPPRSRRLVIRHPYTAVRVDTTVARHALPPSRLVSGVVYDVTTGLIEIVDPATED